MSLIHTLQRHYIRILRLWPKDYLRPGVQVQDSLKRRLYERLVRPGEAAKDRTPANAALIAQLPQLDESAELEQVNAMYSLLENRYTKQYPVSEELYNPGFKPPYYANLLHEQEEAPRRTWLGRKWLRLGNLVKFNPDT